jgi:serine/threonine-protein kinase
MKCGEAVSYVLQIADALAHAVTRDVVHRDIKPSNIVITSQGKAKLVDMGLARFQGLQPGGDLTASGVTLGTFDYISPEQARDPRTADVRSDIYSLGCTLYFMLTGRPPFPEGTVLQKLLQHNSDDPIDPREYNSDLPDVLVSLLQKMLAKDPARRYQTPSDLIADLLHFAEPLGLNRVEMATKWDNAATSPNVVGRHLTWIIPAACLALAFLVMESWERKNDQRWRKAWTEARSGDAPAAAVPAASPSATTAMTVNVPPLTPPTVDGAPTVPTASATAAPAVTPTVDPAAPRELPAPRDGVLVVCDAEGEGRYASLRAACFAARNGDVIELCYDGPRAEKAALLNNLKVTVRAGAGYRPIVQFRPGDVAVPNAPRAMLTVVGGRIDWVGVDLELQIPASRDLPTERWTMFDLQNAEHLGFDRSTLTVRTAAASSFHADVALFGMSVPPGMPAMMNTDDALATTAPEPVDIRLDNCIVRGDATLLRAADVQSASFVWENGLLAIADAALVVRGSSTAPRGPGVRFELRHVTAAVGGEFVRVVNDFESPYLPKLTVRVADSIVTSLAERPLFEFQGVDARSDFLADFDWTAERTVYDGFPPETFWRLASSAEGTQMLTFDEWLLQWGPQREVQTGRATVRWSKPLDKRSPLEAAASDDFALDAAAADNRPLAAAGDGSDLGFTAPLLRAPYDAAAPSE